MPVISPCSRARSGAGATISRCTVLSRRVSRSTTRHAVAVARGVLTVRSVRTCDAGAECRRGRGA
eukprot:4698801-Alexandrium_andersonii.AAC.1